MKKLNYLLLALAIICIIAMGVYEMAFHGQIFYTSKGNGDSKGEMVRIYGQTLSRDSERVNIDGEQIGSYEELSNMLAPFRNIKYLNLGKFDITLDQRKSFEQRFPGVKVESKVYLNIWGQKVYTTDRVIDFTKSEVYESHDSDSDIEMSIDNLKPLLDVIPDLPLLKKVVFGKETMTLADREELRKRYPDIDFDIASIITIGNKNFNTAAARVDLNGLNLESDYADKLAEFRNLDTVNLLNQPLSFAEKKALVERFPKVNFLWEVKFNDNLVFNSDDDDINLKGARIKFDDIEEFIPLFNNLKRIDMTNCAYTNDELAAFREKLNEKYGVDVAWTVHMGDWSLKTDQVAFSVLIYTYDYKRLTSYDIQVLKYCNKLQALDLGHQAISDLTVIGELKDLRILILADNAISDIKPLANLKHLHYIELFVNNIRDMSPLGECKELVDINIGWNWFSDVSALLDFPIAERIWMISTSVSAADQQKIREAYPNAICTFTGKNSLANNWRGNERYSSMMHCWYSKTITSAFTKYDGMVFKD